MEALSGLDMAFDDGSSDDDDLINQDALLRGQDGLPSFEASFRPPPTPAAPIRDAKGKGRAGDPPSRPASSLAGTATSSSHPSTNSRRTGASTPATDDAGLTTFARKPSAFAHGIVAQDTSLSGDTSDAAAALRANSSAAVIAKLDLSTPAEEEGEHELAALNDDPTFASPSGSPPPPGRRRPSANGRLVAPLPKPGRAVSAASTDMGSLAASGMARTKSGNKNNLTLREQEKVIDDVKKENFSLKLKIYFLEERLAKLAPDQIDLALKENIELKVDFQTLQQELKKHKRMCLNLNRALEALQAEQEAAVDAASARPSSDDAKRIRDLERELERLRAERRGRAGSYDGEDARSEIARLRDELDSEREAKEDALAQLRDRHDGGSDGLRSSAGSRIIRRGGDDTERLQRRLNELQQDNASLSSQIAAQVTMLASRNAEKEQLYDEIENLKQDVQELEAELDVKAQADPSAHGDASQRSTVEMQEEMDHYRDKMSSTLLEMEHKEREIQELLQDGDARDAEHATELKRVHREYENAMAAHDDMQEALEERDGEVAQMADKLTEFEQLYDARLDDLEEAKRGITERDTEIGALAEDLKKLGQAVYDLEEEVADKAAHINELGADLDIAEKQLADQQTLHDQVITALKEKLSSVKTRITELTTQNEQLISSREQADHLARSVASLEEKSRTEAELRRKLDDERDGLARALRNEEEERDRASSRWKRERRDMESRWQQDVDEQKKAVESAHAELARAKDRVKSLEGDVAMMQQAMGATKHLGAANVGLELERDRLKRDLVRAHEDVSHLRGELARSEDELRERALAASTATAESRDLAAQLASQTSSRLALSDKLDETARALRNTQAELSAKQNRLQHVESDLAKGSKSMSRSESQYRDQLSERNALLSTICQYMDRILGADKRKAGQPELKPTANFDAFHDRLIARLKTMSQVQMTWEKRIREIDTKLTDQYTALKRQQDSKLRRLESFDQSVRVAKDAQQQWKQRVFLKQSELDAAKATSAELQEQINSLRTRVQSGTGEPGSAAKVRAGDARASTAERRLAATQTQLGKTEAALEDARAKVSKAEASWLARLQELEQRVRAADERTKRERQGAKERVNDLLAQVSDLEKQVGGANKRNDRLGHVVAKVAKADMP